MKLRGAIPGAALVPRLPRAIIFRPSGALELGSLRSHIDEPLGVQCGARTQRTETGHI